ncbi:MAG: efflux RND transporter periplasmic adaptor subunit [Cyclobacteriaceae bacterium]
MKKTSILVLLALTWIAYACSTSVGKDHAIEDPDLIPVGILPLQKQETSLPIHASGQFTTNDETWLSFKTGGVIEKIFVKEGQAIQKGQLLATLNLTEINAQVSQALLSLEKAKRDFARATNLYKDSVATLEQYQNAKTGMELAAQQYEAARFNKTYSEIRAIDNGYVLKKAANEGQVVSTGSPVLQTNSGRGGNWSLRVGVNDGDWARLAIGDRAEITMDALPGKIIQAQVVRKSSGIDPYTGTFAVELGLKGPVPAVIASGLFGKAVIIPSATSSVWTIPYESLLDGDANTGYVFITNDLRTAVQRKVIIRSIDHRQVVVSAGLENAKALIVSGSAYLRDQSAIRILSASANN